jgi:hypothetical protein
MAPSDSNARWTRCKWGPAWLADLIAEQAEELARIETTDQRDADSNRGERDVARDLGARKSVRGVQRNREQQRGECRNQPGTKPADRGGNQDRRCQEQVVRLDSD